MRARSLLAAFSLVMMCTCGEEKGSPPVVSNARWDPSSIKKGEDSTLKAEVKDKDCDLGGGTLHVGDSSGSEIANSSIPGASSCGGTATWSPASSNLKEGSNTYKIWVKDEAGNLSNKASATLKVEAACKASTEVCDGKDNDCDGETDEGSGLCGSGETCQGSSGCKSSCTPSTEICDGKDNDCDGSTDEGSSLCPSGQTCQGSSGCKSSCTPSTEICDGKDNDCDGSTDEGSSLCSSGQTCKGTSGCQTTEPDPMGIPLSGLSEGQSVNVRVQVISGTVPSSIRSSVTRGRVTITNILGTADTDFTPSTSTGSFSQSVELSTGNNTIDGSFYNSSSTVVGRLKRITIVNTIPPLDMRVRLTWNTDKNDLDLHVKDPNGEEVYFSHKTSALGGYLDIDDINGYGPETFTLECAKPGNYIVSIKYYDDNGVTSSVTATIKTSLEESSWSSFGSKTFSSSDVGSTYVFTSQINVASWRSGCPKPAPPRPISARDAVPAAEGPRLSLFDFLKDK